MTYAVTVDNFKGTPSAAEPRFTVVAAGYSAFMTQAVVDHKFPGPDRVPAYRFGAHQLVPHQLVPHELALKIDSVVLAAPDPVAVDLLAVVRRLQSVDRTVGQLWPEARRRYLGAAVNSAASYYGVGSMWLLPYAIGAAWRVPTLSITTDALGGVIVQVGLWGPYGLVPLRDGADALTFVRVAKAVEKLHVQEERHHALDPKGNALYWAKRLVKDRLVPLECHDDRDPLEWVLAREGANDTPQPWPHHRTDTAVRRILRLPRSL